MHERFCRCSESVLVVLFVSVPYNLLDKYWDVVGPFSHANLLPGLGKQPDVPNRIDRAGSVRHAEASGGKHEGAMHC